MNDELSTHDRFPARRLIGGLVLITVGTLFLLQQFDITHIGRLWAYWPAILIVLGLARIIDPGCDRRSGGFWLLAIGSWLLVSSLGLFGLSYGTSWPLLLVVFGAIIIGQALFEKPWPETSEPHNDR